MNSKTASSWRVKVFTALAATMFASAGALVTAAPAQAIEDTFVGFGSNTNGIEFEHGGWGGKRLLFLSPNPGCTGPTTDIDFQIGGMPEDWNDEISSFQTMGGGALGPCWAKHYKNVNFGTPSIGFGPTLSYVGDAMNDQTTSIQWS